MLVVVSGGGGGDDVRVGDRRMRRRGDQSGVQEGRRSTLRAFAPIGHTRLRACRTT